MQISDVEMLLKREHSRPGWEIAMLAKQMERMVIDARRDKQILSHWVMTAETLDVLRAIGERPLGDLDAPKLQDILPPMFMGIPIIIGEPKSEDPSVDLVTMPTFE